VTRRPPRAHHYTDDDGALGIVRYDGDPEVWRRLALEVLDAHGYEEADLERLAPPVLGWWKFNPGDPAGAGWHWWVDRRDGPGRGRFQGAEVKFAK